MGKRIAFIVLALLVLGLPSAGELRAAAAADAPTPYLDLGDPELPAELGSRAPAAPSQIAGFSVALDEAFGTAELRQIPITGTDSGRFQIAHTQEGERVYVHNGSRTLYVFDGAGDKLGQVQTIPGNMVANDDHVVVANSSRSQLYSPDLVPRDVVLPNGSEQILAGDHLWKQEDQSGPSIWVTRTNLLTGVTHRFRGIDGRSMTLHDAQVLSDGTTVLVRSTAAHGYIEVVEGYSNSFVASFPVSWIAKQVEIRGDHVLAYGNGDGPEMTERRVLRLSDAAVLNSYQLEANSYVESDEFLVAFAPGIDDEGGVHFFDAETGEKRLGGVLWEANATGWQQASLSPDGDVLWVVKRLRDESWALVLASIEPQFISSSLQLYMPGIAADLHLGLYNMAAVNEVLVNGQPRPWSVESYRRGLTDLLSISFDPTDTTDSAVVDVITVDGTTERLTLGSAPPRGTAALVLHLDDQAGLGSAYAADDSRDMMVSCGAHGQRSVQFVDPVLILLVPALEDCEVERTAEMQTGGMSFVFGATFEGPFPMPIRTTANFVSSGVTHIAVTHDPTRRPVYIYVGEEGDGPGTTAYEVGLECGDYISDQVTLRADQSTVFFPPLGNPRCEATLSTGADVVVSSFTQFNGWSSQNTNRFLSPAYEGYVLFSADHGGSDIWNPVVVGQPGEGIGSASGAGAVAVLPVFTSGEVTGQGSQLVHQAKGGLGGRIESDDRFGSALARGDFNGDGWIDLAVGVPGEAIGPRDDAGAVSVLYGTGRGFPGSGGETITQSSRGVPGLAEAGDEFGAALAAVDFNGDGIMDLAVGAPGEALGSIADAGVVHVFYGSDAGLETTGSVLLSQNSPGVESRAEAGDRFGEALAASRGVLAVGSPGEGIGSISNAGAMHLIDGFTMDSQAYWQGRGMGGAAESGDRFGSVVDMTQRWILAGVPEEDVGAVGDAGVIQVLGRSDTDRLGIRADRTLTQADFPRIGLVEVNDNFGASLDLVPRTASHGFGFYLLAGAPGEDAGRGAVHFGSLFTNASLQELATWQQGDGFFPNVAEFQDRLGAQVAFGPRGSLLASAPGEDFGTGAVFYAVNEWRELTQSSPGVAGASEQGDSFGAALGG